MITPADLNWSLRRGRDARVVAEAIRDAAASIREFLKTIKIKQDAGTGSSWSEIKEFSWSMQPEVVKVLLETFLDDEIVKWFVQEDSHMTDVPHYLKYLENKADRLDLIHQLLTSSPVGQLESVVASSQASTAVRQTAKAIFFSYSSADEPLRVELEQHLAVLKRAGLIETWGFRQIEAGDDWRRRIDDRLNSATIILLLVSANFLASDYCWNVEMRRAIERHDAGSAIVVPIVLKDCDWHAAPFSKLQLLPEGAKPVTRWRPRDRAWASVVAGIRRLLEAPEHKS